MSLKALFESLLSHVIVSPRTSLMLELAGLFLANFTTFKHR